MQEQPKSQMQEEPKSIILELHNKENNDIIGRVHFDHRILAFKIGKLDNDDEKPYPISNEVISTIKPLQIMKTFLEAHQYNPESIKVTKPIKSNKYETLVDPITKEQLEKYTNEKNADEASDLIKLTNYLIFDKMCDAVCAAVATIYYVDEDEKSLDEYIKKHELEHISSEHICEIMKIHEDLFKLIENKAKEELGLNKPVE